MRRPLSSRGCLAAVNLHVFLLTVSYPHAQAGGSGSLRSLLNRYRYGRREYLFRVRDTLQLLQSGGIGTVRPSILVVFFRPQHVRVTPGSAWSARFSDTVRAHSR